MALGGRRPLGIIIVLLILINVIALGLTNSSLQKLIQNNGLITYDRFEFTPQDAIADGNGGLYITERNSEWCNLYHYDTKGIATVGTIKDRCRNLHAASDELIIYGSSWSSEYKEDISAFNYTIYLSGYKNKKLIRYYPSILFPTGSNETNLELIWNQVTLRDQSLFIPGFVSQSDQVDVFVWQFNLKENESQIYSLFDFSGNPDELEYYYQNPYGLVLSTGSTLYYLDPITDQIGVNILTHENQTHIELGDDETTQLITAEGVADQFNCLTTVFCEVFVIDEKPMYFELDNNTGTIIRTYGGREDRIQVTQGRYFFSLADVGLDHMVALLTSTSIYGAIDQETSDNIYSTYVQDGQVHDYTFLVNPDYYEFPWYSAHARDGRSFYVVARNYTRGLEVSNFVVSTIRIGIVDNLGQISNLWRISLPASIVLMLIVIYLYHKDQTVVVEELYPENEQK